MARDYRAELAARNARAQAAGFTSYSQMRRAQAAGVDDPAAYVAQRAERAAQAAQERRAAAEQRAAERQAAADWRRRYGRSQVVETGDGKVVRTTSRLAGWGAIDRHLAGHGTRPVRMTLVLKDGTRSTVWDHGYAADRARRAVRSVGDAVRENNAMARNLAGSDLKPVSLADVVSVQFELVEGGV